jgi:hypothetical protein
VASAVADKDFSWVHATPEKIHRPIVPRLMGLVELDPMPPPVHYHWNWGGTVTIVTRSRLISMIMVLVIVKPLRQRAEPLGWKH